MKRTLLGLVILFSALTAIAAEPMKVSGRLNNTADDISINCWKSGDQLPAMGGNVDLTINFGGPFSGDTNLNRAVYSFVTNNRNTEILVVFGSNFEVMNMKAFITLLNEYNAFLNGETAPAITAPEVTAPDYNMIVAIISADGKIIIDTAKATVSTR